MYRNDRRLTSEIKIVIFQSISDREYAKQRKLSNFGRVAAQFSFSPPL